MTAAQIDARRQKAIRALAAGMGLDESAAAARLYGGNNAGTTTGRDRETYAATDAERHPGRLSDLDFGDTAGDRGGRGAAAGVALTEKTTLAAIREPEPIYVTDTYFERQLIHFLGQAYVDVDPRRSLGNSILGGFLKECLQWAMTYLKWREEEQPRDFFPPPVDLVAEYERALADTTDDALRPLRQAGVTDYSLDLARPAAAKVSFYQGGLFQFDPEEGQPAFIVPVRVDFRYHESDDPVRTMRDGPIIDLVMFQPKVRSAIAQRYGGPDFLGCCPLQDDGNAKPVRLFRTPLDWMRADCDGLVPLTGDRSEFRRLLRRFKAITVEQGEVARLKKILEEPAGPKIYAGGRHAG